MSLILNGTTGISDVDGTAAAPALTGTDSNTGIFFPAADQVAITTGGTQRAVVDASGNVGIGTSSPAAKFDIETAASTNGGLQIGVNGTSAGTVGTGGFVSNGGSLTDFGVRAINNLVFATGSGAPERARIDSSGTLIVGATTTPDTCKLGVTHDGNVNFGVVINNTSAVSQNETAIRFRRNGASVGEINTTLTATSYNTSSDYRLKEDIAPMTGALATVSALKPVTYKWKSDGSDAQGFIAHELQAVVPEAVVGEKDAVKEEQYEVTPAVKDADGNTITEAVMGTRTVPSYQGIDTSFLVATLTAAIQEQQTLITALTTRITALEGTP